MHAYNNQLRDDSGNVIATFSSHWAACAAMIRMSNPNFKSLGGDKPTDLEIEKSIRVKS